MTIDRTVIRALAELSALDPERVGGRRLVEALGEIAEFCGVLESLPDTSLETDSTPRPPWRDDRIVEADIRSAVFAEAPRIVEDHFRVAPVPATGAGDEQEMPR